MPLGDSITQGVGSSTGAGYRGPLEQLLGQDVDFVGSQRGGPIPDPNHEGHSGYMIGQLGDGIDGWLALAQPDVVLLHAGINDLDRGQGDGAAGRLLALITHIKADRPGSVVLVMGLIPTTGGVEQQAVRFNAALRAHAGEAFTYVEPPSLGPDDMADRLHPNDAGYQRLAEAFGIPLAQVTSKTPPGVQCPPPPE
ncbi:SGNH/GDSL hydrolase family protein [Streptomyces sp. NPDC090077]|uniref:SGNH/GDSL hydrolase family protein n=1 Tax=Streptomyces sp. NPDC090077 TaxID=3365938 RepID=UPI0037F3D4C3